jgi:hypothetical protein
VTEPIFKAASSGAEKLFATAKRTASDLSVGSSFLHGKILLRREHRLQHIAALSEEEVKSGNDEGLKATAFGTKTGEVLIPEKRPPMGSAILGHVQSGLHAHVSIYRAKAITRPS